MKIASVTNRGDVLVDGEALKRIREQRLLTQGAFADQIGVSRNWLNATERAGRRAVLRSIVGEIAGRLKVAPSSLIAREGFELVTLEKRPFFDVTVPAGSWVETEPREEPDGFVPVPADLPADSFCLRIFGQCMEPDFPSGAVIVFVPVRDGEAEALQFEQGKPAYFEHSDGKATFKLVFFEPSKDRYRLQPINPKFKTLYVPAQMKARISRAVKLLMIRDIS